MVSFVLLISSKIWFNTYSTGPSYYMHLLHYPLTGTNQLQPKRVIQLSDVEDNCGDLQQSLDSLELGTEPLVAVSTKTA